jgi:hypothetical protein
MRDLQSSQAPQPKRHGRSGPEAEQKAYAASGAAAAILSPSQIIEIRELQPMVLRWTFSAAQAMAVVLLVSSAGAFAASLWAALKEPTVWAVLPRGDVLSITPLQPTAAMEQGMRAAVGSQGAAR